MAGREGHRGHVFVSYVREDAVRVDHLQACLESAGIPVWRDVKDLWPGEVWKRRLRDEIGKNSLAFMPCFSRSLSKRARSTMYEELTWASEEYRKRNPDVPWIFPVLLEECDVPTVDLGGDMTLHDLQWVQLDENPGQQLDRLISALKELFSGEPLWREGMGHNSLGEDLEGSQNMSAAKQPLNTVPPSASGVAGMEPQPILRLPESELQDEAQNSKAPSAEQHEQYGGAVQEAGPPKPRGIGLLGRLARRRMALIATGAGTVAIVLTATVYFVSGGSGVPARPQNSDKQSSAASSVSPRPLSSQSLSLSVNVPPSAFQNPASRSQDITHLISKLNQELAARHLQGRQVGFVEVFAPGPIGGIAQAVATAGFVLNALRSQDPVFAKATGRGYWWVADNSFEFNLYFFT